MMDDYQIGLEIARRGWLLKPAVSAEIEHGYHDGQQAIAQEMQEAIHAETDHNHIRIDSGNETR